MGLIAWCVLFSVAGLTYANQQKPMGYFARAVEDHQRFQQFLSVREHTQNLNAADIAAAAKPSVVFDRDTLLLKLQEAVSDKNASRVSSSCLHDIEYFLCAFADTIKHIIVPANATAPSNIIPSAPTIDFTKICGGYRSPPPSDGWPLKLLDSYGTESTGLLQGNTYQLGDYKECRQIQEAVPATDDYPNGRQFQGKYCAISVNETIVANVVAITRGICVPYSCSTDDIQELAKIVTFKPSNGTSPFNSLTCHEPLDITQDTSALAMIVICAIIAALIVCGTFYDLVWYQPQSKQLSDKLPVSTSKVAPKVSFVDEKVLPDLKSVHLTKKEHYDSLWFSSKAIMAFSLYTNAQRIFNTDRREGTLDCLHGIRCISMSWVILGHTYFYARALFDNLLYALGMLKEPLAQVFLNATVSVDTFLLLSGLLLSYLWLKDTKKRNGKPIRDVKQWILFYVHRFIRLTPVYMLTMGLSSTLFRYLADGPLWNQNGVEPHKCNLWWWNLLYINNFVGAQDMCMGHTWYLANDMQFHYFSPLFLVSTWFNDFIGIGIAAAVVVAETVARGWYMAHMNYAPNGIWTLDGAQFNNADPWGYFNDVYIRPYFRCGPYAIGLVVGYALYKVDNKKLKIPFVINWSAWLVAAVSALACVFGLYNVSSGDHVITKLENGMYSGLNRNVWALAVGWVIFACVTGNGGVVNTILSSRLLIPLSRLTYCAYLVHPYVMQLWYDGRDNAQHFDSHYTMVYNFFGHLVVAYLAAFVLSLSFEAPFLILEKLIIPHGKRESGGSGGGGTTKEPYAPYKSMRSNVPPYTASTASLINGVAGSFNQLPVDTVSMSGYRNSVQYDNISESGSDRGISMVNHVKL